MRKKRTAESAFFNLRALVGLLVCGAAACLMLSGALAEIRGQCVRDGFNPNANSVVEVVIVQPDGKILIGGDFTKVLGMRRNHIARLNPDGTLDTVFDPNANDVVYSIAVQADGKILAGGYFELIGGQAREYIARLDATTGLADSFNPNPNDNGVVFLIVVQPDGKILVCGTFGSIGGQTREYIARLDATTGLADSFNPGPNNLVYTIAVLADGKILAGGLFTSVGGQPRNHIARVENDDRRM